MKTVQQDAHVRTLEDVAAKQLAPAFSPEQAVVEVRLAMANRASRNAK